MRCRRYYHERSPFLLLLMVSKLASVENHNTPPPRIHIGSGCIIQLAGKMDGWLSGDRRGKQEGRKFFWTSRIFPCIFSPPMIFLLCDLLIYLAKEAEKANCNIWCTNQAKFWPCFLPFAWLIATKWRLLLLLFVLLFLLHILSKKRIIIIFNYYILFIMILRN